MTNKNNMLAAALSYIERGWEVFPVPRGTKMGYSVKQRGFDNGKPWGKTKDADEIREYWRRLPRANIGVPMGVDSGIFDIEVDTRSGHSNLKQDGAVSLAALEEKHGALPPTLMFVSPSGSVHNLFAHPGGDFRVKTSNSKLGVGIDVKGDGSMSVAPPSITRKGVYRWINNLPVASAPVWLLDRVCVAGREPAAKNAFKQTGEEETSREPPSRDAVACWLALIPNDDDDYDVWKQMGLAIWASTAGEGLDLFHAWSRKWHGYDADDTDLAWRQIESSRPDRYKPHAVLNKLEEVMPDWRDRLEAGEVDAQINKFLEVLGEAA